MRARPRTLAGATPKDLRFRQGQALRRKQIHTAADISANTKQERAKPEIVTAMDALERLV